MAIDPPQVAKAIADDHGADIITDGYVMVADTTDADVGSAADKNAKDKSSASSALPHGDDMFDMSIEHDARPSSKARMKTAAIRLLSAASCLPTAPAIEDASAASDTPEDPTGFMIPVTPANGTMPGSSDAETPATDNNIETPNGHVAAETASSGLPGVDTESLPSLAPAYGPKMSPTDRLASAFTWLPALAFDGHPRNASGAFRFFITEFINHKYQVDLATKRDTADLDRQIPGIAFYVVEEYGAKLWPTAAAAGQLDPVVDKLERYLAALFNYSQLRRGPELGYDQRLIDILRNPLPSSSEFTVDASTKKLIPTSSTQNPARDPATYKLLRGRIPHEVLNEAFHSLCAFPHAKMSANSAPGAFKLMATTWCERHLQAVNIQWDPKHADEMDEHAPQIALAFVQKHYKNVWREKNQGALAHLLPPMEHYLRVLFRVPADGPEITTSASASHAEVEGPRVIGLPVAHATSSTSSSQPPHSRKSASDPEPEVAPPSPPPRTAWTSEPGRFIGLMCTAPECDKLEGHYVFPDAPALREHLTTVHEFDEEMAREHTGKVAIVRWGYP